MKKVCLNGRDSIILSFVTCIFVLLSGCSGSSTIKSNELLIADGQINQAIANYEKANQEDPNNHELLYHLAKALYKSGNYEQATVEISKAILLEPQYDSYRTLAGKIAFAKSNFFNATNQLINALLLNKSNLEAYYFLARSYLEMGEAEKALAQLETAVALEPLYFDAQLLWTKIKFSLLRNSLKQTDQKDKTKTEKNNVADTTKEDPVQQIKDLIVNFKVVLKSNPASVEGTILLSEIYSFLGNSKQAQAILMSWIDRYDLTSEEIVLSLVRKKYENGQLTDALILLNKILKPSINSKILKLKIRQKVKPEGGFEKEMLELLRNSPASLDLLLMAAQLEAEKGNLLKAESYLQTCIEKNPESAGCYFKLSAVLADQKDILGSQWALKKAFELSPNDKEICIDYIENLIDRGEIKIASTLLTRSSMDETDPKIAFLKGKVAKMQSDFKKADEYFQYSRKYVYAVDVETELADLELRQGKFLEASRRLKTIETVAPGHLKIALVKATMFDKTGQLTKIPPILTPHLTTPQGLGRVHLKLADSYARMGNVRKAISLLNQGSKIWTRHLELVQSLTFYLGLVKEYSRAIEILTEMQTFRHKYNQLFHQRLRMYYYKSGQIERFKEYRTYNQ